jgi:hypothetical protein
MHDAICRFFFILLRICVHLCLSLLILLPFLLLPGLFPIPCIPCIPASFFLIRPASPVGGLLGC